MTGRQQEREASSLLSMLQKSATAVIHSAGEAEMLEKTSKEHQQQAWLRITRRASEVRFLSLQVRTQGQSCSICFLILKHHGITEYFGTDNQQTWRSLRHAPTSDIGRQVWSRLHWLQSVLSTWHDTAYVPLLEEEGKRAHDIRLSRGFDPKNTEKMPPS